VNHVPRRISRRIRREIDEPGLKASLAADVNIVTSGSTGKSAVSRQEVHVRQGRSARTDPAPEEKEEE
jgi:hypothetical protein